MKFSFLWSYVFSKGLWCRKDTCCFRAYPLNIVKWNITFWKPGLAGWLTSLLEENFAAIFSVFRLHSTNSSIFLKINVFYLIQDVLFFPFMMKFDSCEIYFICEPQNLIPKKRNIIFGTKNTNKLTQNFPILSFQQQFKLESKLIILSIHRV